MTALRATPGFAIPRRTPPPGRRAPAWLAPAFALALVNAPHGAQGAAWTNVNPGGGGAFTCSAVGSSGIIIVGSDIGGVYRSDNHGLSWENIGYINGGLERAYVASAAFDPIDSWIAYVGTEGGLYRSANGGSTFTRTFDDGFWTAIAPAPADGNVVYAARQSSYNSLDPLIYRSMDQGMTWALMGALPAGSRVIKLEVQPTDPYHLFAVSGWEKLLGSNSARRALYVSSDGGSTWTDAHGDSTNQGMTGNPWDATYDPIYPDTILATSVVGPGNVDESMTWSGFTWRGSQSGGVWTQLSAHTGAIVSRYGTGQILTVDARRDGPGCGECGVFKSVDFGATWTRTSDMWGWDPGWIGSIAWAYNASFSGVAKTLRRDPSNWGAIYWITPQFVWRSTDWGVHFSSVFTTEVSPGFWKGRGMNNVAPASLAVSGTMVYAGYYDLGIWRSPDSGASWQASNDPTLTGAWGGKGGNCMTILTDPERPNMVWASQGETMASAWVLRTTESAVLGTWNTTLGVPPGFISGLALDRSSPSSNRTLYVSSGGDVYKSADDGVNWVQAFDCDSCYVNAASGNTVFTGGPKGLWRSLDGGTSWTELAPATFHFSPNAYTLTQAKWSGAHSILISGDTVYVAVYAKKRGLYRSIDGGNSWSLVRPDNFAKEVAMDDSGTLFLGSSSATNSGGMGTSGSTGVQISHDYGETWSSLNSGLPWPFAWPIEALSEPGGYIRLYVGSPGSGIWTTLTTAGVPVAVGEGSGTPLRLSGFMPNPARERITVSFSLPSSAPASIEIFDIAGRRVLQRDVGWMGPGEHVLPLGSAFRPTPGLYAIRLAQGGYSTIKRSVVVR